MGVYIVCPFFKFEKGKNVYCEAHTLKFKSYKGKKTLTANFCESFNYVNCKHAQKLTKKYEDDETDGNS